MKTTILPKTRAMAALLLLTSACDQGGEDLLVDREAVECSPEDECDREPTEAETLAYSKEIVVSDGYNRVTLLVASDDPELVEGYDDDSFEIAPVFERPELPESEEGSGDDKTLDAAHDFSQSVSIEERSVSLQDGAVGYELRDVGSEYRPTPPKMCVWPTEYISRARFVRLDVMNGCTKARILQQFNWFWIDLAFTANQCGGMPPFVGGNSYSSRLRLEVCPGPAVYHVAFIH